MEYFINPDSMRIPASEFDKKLQQLRELYPPGVAYVSQNLFDSHDVNRVLSHIVNRGIGNFRDWGKYYNLSLAAKNKAYKVNAPNLDDIRLLKLLVIMQMTYVGAPMIYYGDEVGMWGANDPDCRKPMLWDEYTYTAESTNPDGSKRSADPVLVRHDVLAWYKKLIEIRNMKAVFRTGAYTTLIADDQRDVFAFRRSSESDEAVVVFNNAQQEQTILVPVQYNLHYVDMISGRVYKVKRKKLKATVEAKWGAVLIPLHKMEIK
jgi:glycosidase